MSELPFDVKMLLAGIALMVFAMLAPLFGAYLSGALAWVRKESIFSYKTGDCWEKKK